MEELPKIQTDALSLYNELLELGVTTELRFKKELTVGGARASILLFCDCDGRDLLNVIDTAKTRSVKFAGVPNGLMITLL